MYAWMWRGYRWVWSVILMGGLPVATSAQYLTTPPEELIANRWEQRVAHISLTDTSDQTREGYILYSRSNGFAWHDGYRPYQVGDSFTWIPTQAWTKLAANRRGKIFPRALQAGLLAMQLIGSRLLINSMGQNIRWRSSLGPGIGATVILGSLTGTMIGIPLGLAAYEPNQTYLSWQADQRQLANLALLPSRFKADTVDGILVPRNLNAVFLPNPYPALGVNWMQGAYLPWRSYRTREISLSLPFAAEVENLVQIPANYQEISLLWRFRTGTHLGIRSGFPMPPVERVIVGRFNTPIESTQIIGRYSIERGRVWGILAEQQVLPVHPFFLQRWRLFMGGGLFGQRLFSNLDFMIPGTPDVQTQSETNLVLGVHMDLHLSYYLNNRLRLYTLIRGQHTQSWIPSPMVISTISPDAMIRLGELNQAGYTLAVGATAFLW